MLRRLPLLAALTLLASLPLAASALADPGNGAQFIETPFSCQEYPIGTVCSAVRIVINTTQTASGNYIVAETYDIQTTYSTPSCERSESEKGNIHYMLTSAEFELEQSVFNERGQFSYDCGDRSAACTYHLQDVLANGEVRHVRTEFNCEVGEPAAASA
jgi:hypothetical protein